MLSFDSNAGGDVQGCSGAALYAGAAVSSSPHKQVVRLLLDSGADYNRGRECDHRVAIHEAARCGQLEVTRLLLDRGADPNSMLAPDDGCWTPVMYAAMDGHLDVLQLLLARGATADHASTDTGTTSLLLSAREGHLEVIKVLLDHGVDINASRTLDGYTALLIAARLGKLEVGDREARLPAPRSSLHDGLFPQN